MKSAPSAAGAMMDQDEPDIDDLLEKAAALKEQGSPSEAMQLLKTQHGVRLAILRFWCLMVAAILTIGSC